MLMAAFRNRLAKGPKKGISGNRVCYKCIGFLRSRRRRVLKNTDVNHRIRYWAGNILTSWGNISFCKTDLLPGDSITTQVSPRIGQITVKTAKENTLT
jgi:hypothetical protein